MRMIKIVFDFNKRFGFTLSEVLVTIGLLGSIAAITIPTLAYNYRGKVLEQQFRATYSDIKAVATVLNERHGDWATYANGVGYNRWYQEFMSMFDGGGPYRGNATHIGGALTNELRAFYGVRSGSGKFRFNITNGLLGAGDPCDNGGVWTDSNGRLWTFNGENSMICVDINGNAKPNRQNVDIFAFIPMSPLQLATFVYNDPGNANNYIGTIVPCNIEMIAAKGASNSVPSVNVKENEEGSNIRTFEKGSGSALDYCPFFEPVENAAVMKSTYCDVESVGCGKSARGRAMTSSNNYWTDYIDYK